MKTVSLLLSALIPDPTQPRKSFDLGELEQLTASIRNRGLLLPIRVKPADADGKHVIVSGHRRHAALEKLEAKSAPCIIVEGPLDESTILAEQLAENIHRENLSPIDEAHAYRRYLALKAIPASQAALELAVPATRISRALPLLELPDEVQTAIHVGTIPKETAYYLSRLPDGEERNRLISQALAGTLSRDAAARAVKVSSSDHADTPAISRASFRLRDHRTLTLSAPAVRLDLFIDTLEELLKAARKVRSQGLDISALSKMFRDRPTTGGAS